MTLKELLILLLILFFALFTRSFRLAYPASMYFDEIYHVPAATLMMHGDFQTPFSPVQIANSEQKTSDWLHPPLAKYLQALSMATFGARAFAWRLPSMMMALCSLLLFYFMVNFLGRNFFFKQESTAKKLNLSSNLALIACFLFSLDGLFLVQARIAMNDVFVLFFALLAIFIYLIYLVRGKSFILLISGACFGLALASKWNVLWILLFVLLKELLAIKNAKQVPFVLFSLLLTPIFVYCLTYLPMFYQGSTLLGFFSLQKTILISQLSNPSTHLYSSNPLIWIFNLRPVWYFVAETAPAWVANIYALGNPLLCLYMLIALPMSIFYLVKKKLQKSTHQVVYFLLLLYSVSFLPWLIFSRPMFFYHYLLAVPFLLVLVAYFLLRFINQIKDQSRRRAVLFNLLFWPFFFFILFYPHWTALPVPENFAKIFYFLLASWR